MNEEPLLNVPSDAEAGGPRAVSGEARKPSRAAEPVPVIGIGGSAGGLEVFKLLLADLPAETGFATVFVQHLDPKHHSMLAEILSRATIMPVREATDGMPVEANHVYVMPANTDLTIAGGALRLAPRTQTAAAHRPIDRFLRSLADDCGSRAIAVILSGAGTDGSAASCPSERQPMACRWKPTMSTLCRQTPT